MTSEISVSPMKMSFFTVLTAFCVVLSACESDDAPDVSPGGQVTAALDVAEEFVNGYYHQFPEEAFEIAYPDTPMDRLGDRSEAAMNAWNARLETWMARLDALDPAVLEGTDAAIPYAFTRDRIAARLGTRVCRTELWKVSSTSNGWMAMLSSTFAVQPVETAAERENALVRLREVPAYIERDVDNLQLGQEAGYLASQSNVDAVLRQATAIIRGAAEDSPFYSPASRSNDPSFQREVRAIIRDMVNPAISRYVAYLEEEYEGRAVVGVGENPDGAACYAASVHYHTSLDLTPDEIHQMGLRQMEDIQAEMARIAEESFGTDDVPALLEHFRTYPEFTFRSEEDILAYARAAVERASVAVHDWFGYVPDTRLVVQPFPAYQKASGGGYYSAGSIDGSRPGTYELGTWMPEAISKVGLEATAFHESYPGHHLQMSVALQGGNVHPVLRYIYVAAVAEGWGLYSELLADEMGLYSEEKDRMGMLSNRALRAARLVVDPGMHVLGWTRQQAVDYMLSNTAESQNAVESEVDRYLATPGQATAYMVGSLEIQRLREYAREQLGDRFDIQGFHDTVLADGAVSLPMLERAVDAWIASRR